MQGRIEGSDLFMYPEHSGCLLDGVTKWEGGPENKHLTSNEGRLPNTDIRYVPVKMNGTYGLRIKNFTAKDYNCSYVYWLKFETIKVFPPYLGIQPDKEAINISCNVAANKVKIDYSVMGLFFKLVIEVKLSIGNLTRELNRTFVQQTDGTFMMEYSLKNDVCNGTLEVSYFFQEFPEIEGNLLNKRGITAEECPGNKDSGSGDHTTAFALGFVIVAVAVGFLLCYFYMFYKKKKFCWKPANLGVNSQNIYELKLLRFNENDYTVNNSIK
ncbi:uncharacterized protein [Mytilus edulis]|uniref:uncharacterized protein n=1 Tax=Mytilus edulis TaxID=6550 RepID=UPI0039F020B0